MSAIDLIFTTSPVEARMYAILNDVLSAAKSAEKIEKSDKISVKTDSVKPDPAVLEFIQKNVKSIVRKSIKSSSGSPNHLKSEWRDFEGESVLFEKVLSHANAFNRAYLQSGESGLEAFAVTTLHRAFVAYVKVEQSSGVLTKDSRVDDYSIYSTISIYGDQEKEFEIADDSFSVFSVKENDESDESLSFDDAKDFVIANASRYSVLLDIFAFETGLMRRYTVSEIAREAAMLANELDVEFDISEFCDAVQKLKVLRDVKSGTVKNKLGLVGAKARQKVDEAIKNGVLSKDDLTCARHSAFFEYAHTARLLNGFCIETTVDFCSLDDMITAAVLGVVENRKASSLDVVADLICADLTREDDFELQIAKREFMKSLTCLNANQEFFAEDNRYQLQATTTEQISLF